MTMPLRLEFPGALDDYKGRRYTGTLLLKTTADITTRNAPASNIIQPVSAPTNPRPNGTGYNQAESAKRTSIPNIINNGYLLNSPPEFKIIKSRIDCLILRPERAGELPKPKGWGIHNETYKGSMGKEMLDEAR